MVKYTKHNLYHLKHFKVYSSEAFSVLTLLCNHHQRSSLEHFSSCKTETLCPLNDKSHFPSPPPPPQPLETTIYFLSL